MGPAGPDATAGAGEQGGHRLGDGPALQLAVVQAQQAAVAAGCPQRAIAGHRQCRIQGAGRQRRGAQFAQPKSVEPGVAAGPYRAVAILQQMPEPPAFGIDLMRDLASIETGRAKTTLLADADALERRLAARTKLASKP